MEIQAQNDDVEITAAQQVKIDSVNSSIKITAKHTLTLICGGTYIKLEPSGIELGTTGNIKIKCTAIQQMGPDTLSADPNALSSGIESNIELINKDKYHFSG